MDSVLRNLDTVQPGANDTVANLGGIPMSKIKLRCLMALTTPYKNRRKINDEVHCSAIIVLLLIYSYIISPPTMTYFSLSLTGR